MPAPGSLGDAIDQALDGGLDQPATYADEAQTNVTYVVLRHRSGDIDAAIGFTLESIGQSTGERRATEISVRLVGDDTSSGLTGKKLRSLPLGDLLATARQALSTRQSEAPKAGSPRFVSVSELRLAPFLTRRRTGVERGDEAYAGLALEYALLVQDGDRTPSQTLASRFGGAPGSWTNRIAEARRRGLLTPVQRGEAGGGLTDKALRVLGHQGGHDD